MIAAMAAAMNGSFLCPRKLAFCSQIAFFAQTPLSLPILSARVLYSKTFATFRTHSRRSHRTCTSPSPPPLPPPPPPGPARPGARPRPAAPAPPRPPSQPVSASLATSSTAPLQRRTPCSRLHTTRWTLPRPYDLCPDPLSLCTDLPRPQSLPTPLFLCPDAPLPLPSTPLHLCPAPPPIFAQPPTLF